MGMSDQRPHRVLVLWDVDHTLIETRGLGSDLYKAAFEQATGRPMRHTAEVTGKTEPAILTETLRLHDIQPTQDLQRRYTDALTDQYRQHIDELRERGRALPGAHAALAALGGEPSVIQSVLTGNLRAVAAIKLEAFGLAWYLDLDSGAYGDDDTHRPALVAVAQARATAKYGHTFAQANTVIVGDSPQDVHTARKGGAQIVAVATGSSSITELREAGATTTLDDLTDADRLVTTISRAGI